MISLRQYILEKGRKVTINLSCIETDIHYPTDSRLLWDTLLCEPG
jgi:hypothetical protein